MISSNQAKTIMKTAVQSQAQRLRRAKEKEDKLRQMARAIPEANDNRNRLFIMTPEMIQMEILRELRKIKELMEAKEK